MSRVQLALNVSDIDQAVDFYSKLFGTEPAKRRDGYANFAVADPPLKLVLIQSSDQPGTLNHLGVEVGTTDDVHAATARLAGEGLDTAVEDDVACCFADRTRCGSTTRRSSVGGLHRPRGRRDARRSAAPGGPWPGCGPGEDVMCCASAPESAARCC